MFYPVAFPNDEDAELHKIETAANAENVIRQKEYADEELQQQGFKYYERKREIIYARRLSESEAPKTIKTSWDTLTANTGDMICYNIESESALPSLDEYDHWPVQSDIFEQTYAADHKTRFCTTAMDQLLDAGCAPYYKHAGVWAKLLTEPTYVQTLESPEPVLFPVLEWLCIGVAGEPWVQSDDGFRGRYKVLD